MDEIEDNFTPRKAHDKGKNPEGDSEPDNMKERESKPCTNIVIKWWEKEAYKIYEVVTTIYGGL